MGLGFTGLGLLADWVRVVVASPGFGLGLGIHFVVILS